MTALLRAAFACEIAKVSRHVLPKGILREAMRNTTQHELPVMRDLAEMGGVVPEEEEEQSDPGPLRRRGLGAVHLAALEPEPAPVEDRVRQAPRQARSRGQADVHPAMLLRNL